MNEVMKSGEGEVRSQSSITMRRLHIALWGFGSCPGNPHTMEKWIFHCKYLAGE